MPRLSKVTLSAALAEVVKLLRESKELSQAKFCELTGFLPQYVSKIETGTRGFGLETLLRYADAFDMPAWQLLMLAENYSQSLQATGAGRNSKKKKEARERLTHEIGRNEKLDLKALNRSLKSKSPTTRPSGNTRSKAGNGKNSRTRSK